MKLKFKFVDRGRHGRVVLFVMCFQHLFLEQEVHPVSDDQCYKLKILSLIVLFYFHHNLYGILQNIPCELLKFSLSTWHYPSFILPDAFHALFSEQNSHVHHDLSLPDNTLFSTSLNSCSFRINPLSYFSRRIRPASIG